MQKNDLIIAQKIVRGTYYNFGKEPFIQTSGIYRFTNEDITSYYHHLENKKYILSIIGSSNQILNSILAQTKKIDAIDISTYSQYYLYLQIATIMSLTKEEYFKYFFSIDKEELFSDIFYEKINNNLPNKFKKFWDTLYMFDDGIDIYNSLLFRHDICNKETIIERNPYLQDNNYEKLKNILKTENIVINTMVNDIMKTKFNEQYDLINLSNVLSYHFKENEPEKYIDYLKKFPNNSEIIHYFYNMNKENEIKFNTLLHPNGYIEDINNKKLLVMKK